MKYSYKIPKFDDGIVDVVDSPFGPSAGHHIATTCAEDFHTHHDGWDCSWPLEFVILREDGSEVGRYSIERDFQPEFYAYEVKEAK